MHLWFLHCRHIVFLTISFLGVTEFTTINILSFLFSCQLWVPILHLNVPSLPDLAFKFKHNFSVVLW